MPIATNNNNLGTTIGNLYTGNGMEVQYFTVVVKDSSATAIDLRVHDDSDGKFHKDGLLDRVLQKAQNMTWNNFPHILYRRQISRYGCFCWS